MRLQYFMACKNAGASRRQFLQWVCAHEDKLAKLERQANLIAGMANDLFSVIKDVREDSANVCYILGRGQSNEPLSPSVLVDGLFQARSLIKKEINKFLEMLEEFHHNTRLEDKLHAVLVSQVLVQEIYGSTTYHTFVDRYQGGV